jgi:hypothetical protein
MDARSWLASRGTAPPEKLASRIEAELANQSDASGMSLSETFTAAATNILRNLVARGVTERAIAIDLLAADALITYALEAAAGECGDFTKRADEIIVQLSEVQPAGKV